MRPRGTGTTHPLQAIWLAYSTWQAGKSKRNMRLLCENCPVTWDSLKVKSYFCAWYFWALTVSGSVHLINWIKICGVQTWELLTWALIFLLVPPQCTGKLCLASISYYPVYNLKSSWNKQPIRFSKISCETSDSKIIDHPIIKTLRLFSAKNSKLRIITLLALLRLMYYPWRVLLSRPTLYIRHKELEFLLSLIGLGKVHWLERFEWRIKLNCRN